MGRLLRAKAASDRVLLGDEAVALGAVDAGIAAAYAYPGTPATEILEYVERHAATAGRPRVAWCANEKTAYEAALGRSLAGQRSLVSMKHVGLNVAADPFINSAIVAIHGGLVLAVADDPGMHSSQNEQDSRFYADFARTLCLEPSDQQEAYDMTREAFDLSERFHVPVMLRLVTRLAHSRAPIVAREPLPERPPGPPPNKSDWILLPSLSRVRWRKLLERQAELAAYGEASAFNLVKRCYERQELGVITAGIAVGYFRECLPELGWQPSHVHVGVWPPPVGHLRDLARQVRAVLLLEEGYPFLERQMRGILPPSVEVRGKLSGHLPPDGELTPDLVRRALGLAVRDGVARPDGVLPNRPPQLCRGCPHGDTYHALSRALAGFDRPVVTSDIGCYTLGVLPPYSAGESCVCMGASIGMARGAAGAGLWPVVAVIGDSTFLHSGVGPLMDAVAADANMTVLILDNQTVAMTGAQPTILPSERLEQVVLGLGVDPRHCHALLGHPKQVERMAAVIRGEIEHRGLSVVIAHRECLEAARKRKAHAAEVAS
jgi:indolepyruvate ferredoxin oxidoreductase alpha subunit